MKIDPSVASLQPKINQEKHPEVLDVPELDTEVSW